MSGIDRIAEAIENADEKYPWYELSPEELAYAVIKAMREPTNAQILAGAKAAVDQHYCICNAWDRRIEPDEREEWLNGMKYGWRAMINEILK